MSVSSLAVQRNLNPIVNLQMESGNHINIELFPEIAPITVENFLHLIRTRFYDGLTFHRVIQGFMIQGGCPYGEGTGGPGWSIVGEFAQNGYENPLSHRRGVISMGRSVDPDSAGSQFFIITDDSPHLDGSYAAFGKVFDRDSMAVVDGIAQTVITPRIEVESGKKIEEIVDIHGKPMILNQANVDMPFDQPRISFATIL